MKQWRAGVYVPGRKTKYLGFFKTAHAYDRYDTGDIQADRPDHTVGKASDCSLGL